MRARAATARKASSWHEDAAATSSCSGFSRDGSPRNAGSLLSATVASAGGATISWARS